MAKEWAKKFYKSKGWINCRASYINERRAIDGGMCEVCKQELGYIVHHKILLTPENINDPEIALNHKHLTFDCKRCHDKEEGHFKDKIKNKSSPVKEGYRFNDDGQLVPALPP